MATTLRKPKGAFSYLENGIKAESHTPIYKMHKYFARRPQNVFSKLIQHYSNEGDVILDPFCGGGVTVFEGLALKRRVIASDINPLASFVTECQVTKVDSDLYAKYAQEIRNAVREFSEPFYRTHDRETGQQLPVRWYEHTYLVRCPNCDSASPLANDQKIKNGWYTCKACNESIRSVDSKRLGTEMLSVTYKVTTRQTQRTVIPTEYDLEINRSASAQYAKLVNDNLASVPEILIPFSWDRQQEDCLHRKGVIKFSDFFTKRHLLVLGFFLEQVKALRDSVSDEVYRLLLLTFSATLRYTNNLTISTSMWQDGRPVAWAKHAYWLPNQFVEVNPVEYIDKRMSAIKSGLRYQSKKLASVTKGKNVADIWGHHDKKCDFVLLNQDSGSLPIQDNAVDLVLTDPPYGSNVQYGELSAFWLVWLASELGLENDRILNLVDEIVVHRKTTAAGKDHSFYYESLRSVFNECHRVLKPDRPMVFTFNSRDPRVWLAVLKAASEAGFMLEPEGVVYQDPIEDYSNTAHTRYAGTLHGDFIYTFIKPAADFQPDPELKEPDSGDIEQEIREIISNAMAGYPDGLSMSRIFVHVFQQLIPKLLYTARHEDDYNQTELLMHDVSIEGVIRSIAWFDPSTNVWRLRDL